MSLLLRRCSLTVSRLRTATLPRVVQHHPRVATYYVKPKEKKGPSGQAWALLAGVTTSIAGLTVYLLGKPEDEIGGMGETEPDKYTDENIIMAYLHRARDRILEFKRSFTEPSNTKLLPDELPFPYQRPYTVILELNDVLIHTEYDRNTGWKYQKRPGVDALLTSLLDHFEIVLFTSENAMTGANIANALDPNQMIMYKLFRDSTKYENGHHVKDLTNLNRPINRVIMIDTDSKSVKYHMDNSIILDKWTGDIHDRMLWDLVPFLLTIATSQVDDVRPVLNYYKSEGDSKNILETFKVRQAQLQAEEERRREALAHHSSHTGGAISTFRLGFGRQQEHSPPPLSSSPPSPAAGGSTVVPEGGTVPVETRDSANEQSDQSWVQWIGSWIGWK